MVNRLLLVIILKWIGISNHYAIGQLDFKNKETNSQQNRSDLWSPDAGVGGGEIG